MIENEEKKGFSAWIDKRLPVFTFINHNLRDYPTPKNLNYFWNFGSLAGITLVIMIHLEELEKAQHHLI